MLITLSPLLDKTTPYSTQRSTIDCQRTHEYQSCFFLFQPFVYIKLRCAHAHYAILKEHCHRDFVSLQKQKKCFCINKKPKHNGAVL